MEGGFGLRLPRGNSCSQTMLPKPRTDTQGAKLSIPHRWIKHDRPASHTLPARSLRKPHRPGDSATNIRLTHPGVVRFLLLVFMKEIVLSSDADSEKSSKFMIKLSIARNKLKIVAIADGRGEL